jgi:SAM-dependent methyltransferase
LKISKLAQTFLFFSRLSKQIPKIPAPFCRLEGYINSVWMAVWLGLLNARRMNEITWSYYMGRSGFEAQEFNVYQGLWSWEADAIRDHFIDGMHVLVAGAGGGREIIALSKLGFEVTGFDFSPYLVDACRRNLEVSGYNACILDAPPDGIPDGLDNYDALYIGRGFYHHIPSRNHRVAFLTSCRRHLVAGAPVLLSDFFTRTEDLKFYSRTQFIASLVRQLSNRNDPVELGDWLAVCMQHAFTRLEIEQELLSASIQPEIYRISPFSDDSHLAHITGRVI